MPKHGLKDEANAIRNKIWTVSQSSDKQQVALKLKNRVPGNVKPAPVLSLEDAKTSNMPIANSNKPNNPTRNKEAATPTTIANTKVLVAQKSTSVPQQGRGTQPRATSNLPVVDSKHQKTKTAFPAQTPTTSTRTIQSKDSGKTVSKPIIPKISAASRPSHGTGLSPSVSSRHVRPQTMHFSKTAEHSPSTSHTSRANRLSITPTTPSPLSARNPVRKNAAATGGYDKLHRVASDRTIERIPTQHLKSKPLNIFEMRSKVIARQLTRIDFELFIKIEPR